VGIDYPLCWEHCTVYCEEVITKEVKYLLKESLTYHLMKERRKTLYKWLVISQPIYSLFIRLLKFTVYLLIYLFFGTGVYTDTQETVSFKTHSEQTSRDTTTHRIAEEQFIMTRSVNGKSSFWK